MIACDILPVAMFFLSQSCVGFHFPLFCNLLEEPFHLDGLFGGRWVHNWSYLTHLEGEWISFAVRKLRENSIFGKFIMALGHSSWDPILAVREAL